MARDPDKKMAYEAEDLVWQETLFDEALGAKGIVPLSRRIISHPWWSEAHPGLAPEVAPTRREAGKSLAYGTRVVRLSLGHEKAWVLTHELAHAIASHHGITLSSHGEGWRSAYVDLTRLVAGQAMSDALAKSFLSRGLSVGAPLPYTPAPAVSDYGLFELHRLDETTGRVA